MITTANQRYRLYIRQKKLGPLDIELSPALLFNERVLWVPATETESGSVFAVLGTGPETETEFGLENKNEIESGSG